MALTSIKDLLTVGPKFTRPARRAAAAAVDRYMLSAPDLSSKPARRRCCCPSKGQTYRRTDGRTLDRFMNAYRIPCGPRNKLAFQVSNAKLDKKVPHLDARLSTAPRQGRI